MFGILWCFLVFNGLPVDQKMGVEWLGTLFFAAQSLAKHGF